jgi:hypothetical protein
MSTVRIEGNKNIANTGVIYGDCNVNSTIINLKFSITDIYKIFAMNDNEKEKSLVNMTEAQKKLAEAIDKFAQAELARSEADKLRAKADENNSLANLNYSKIMLEDREIIKQLMDKLK